MRHLTLFLLLSIARALESAASGAEFLLIEPTARAAGVAGAFSAAHGAPEAMRYNPAGLLKQGGLRASMAHVSALGDWSHDWAGLAADWGSLSWGAEILVTGIKPFELYDVNGDVVAMASAGSQNVMLAGAAPLPGGWLSVGAGLRYFRSQLYTFESTGFAGDLGLQAGHKSIPLRAGLALQNLGRQSAYLVEADPLPLCLRAGIMAPLDLDQGLRLRPSLDVLAFEDSSRRLEFRVGVQAEIYEKLNLRGGVLRAGEFQQYSFGAGFAWEGWGLDYAFQPGTELGANHFVTLHLGTTR